MELLILKKGEVMYGKVLSGKVRIGVDWCGLVMSGDVW